ncbi:alkyl sulfatase C-terminal domain-containing protein [Cupriavidus necator]|uniref:alkyl sulfatase C-terminal domain-containing protein n=1 Tax=Cupriavidus necator TaxID=106590 RepID=UPI001F48226A|nr:alkyl sulfatase C-terminal domain-containing protein [Cupriavidus necator]
MRHAKPDATVTMSKATLDRISLRQITLSDAVRTGEIKVEGDGRNLTELMGFITTFDPSFNIVTPIAKH